MITTCYISERDGIIGCTTIIVTTYITYVISILHLTIKFCDVGYY
uniref:Uncharacterized protein n=1 Tax=Arundo donax TaxID=35708 RepID=A0A0A9G194_ARUDO